MKSNNAIEYRAPFATAIDEEPNVETIDMEWMTETAPSEYARAKDEHSSYLGCTYREATLRDISHRALEWFGRDGGEADGVAEGSGTDDADYNSDLRMFFATIQASAYCKALAEGADGKQAMRAASEAMHMVATPYRDWLAEWVEEF